MTRDTPNRLAAAQPPASPPVYYECGCCSQLHSALWNGDCREDAARLNPEDLDARHGLDGWAEIDMDQVDDYQAGRLTFWNGD